MANPYSLSPDPVDQSAANEVPYILGRTYRFKRPLERFRFDHGFRLYYYTRRSVARVEFISVTGNGGLSVGLLIAKRGEPEFWEVPLETFLADSYPIGG